MSSLGRLARMALVVGCGFATADLWQLALIHPASIGWTGVAWLVGLYVGASVGGAFGLAAVVRVVSGRHRLRIVAAVLLGAGTYVLTQEVGLGAMEPLSPWRPCVIGGAVLLGLLVAFGIAQKGPARALPMLTVPIVVAMLLGAVGAARGFALPGAGSDRGEGPRPTGPNFIIVLIDTLRADHLSSYGYARPTSPRLDAFAKEGVLFTRAYSQSTWTKPATASLFTGRYASQHQAYLEWTRLPDSEVLLPEALGALGYRTAVFSGNPWITPHYGFGQGVDDFYSIYDERFAHLTLFMTSLRRISKWIDHRARVYNRLKLLVQGELSTTERDLELNRVALGWLDRHGDHPFFMHVHYMSPHHPYDPPPPYDQFVPDPTVTPQVAYPKKSNFFFDEGAPLGDAEFADMIARYDGSIRFVDDVFGEFVEGLRARGLLEDTMVVVTSDHGEEFYDHKNWGHGQSVYKELSHVPLIVRHPPRVPADVRVDDAVMTIDVMPTLLELAGGGDVPVLAGRSLLDPIDHPGQAEPREIYIELLYRYGHARALVDARHKLVTMARGDDVRSELYDVQTDFAERRDLGADGAVGAALGERLDAVTTWSHANQSTQADVEIDDEMSKRLKALGYLE